MTQDKDIVERVTGEPCGCMAVRACSCSFVTIRESTGEEAAAEITRLRDVKRRALQIADERAKESVDLRARVAELIEDRARFPDRPDGVGRMIEAHIGNLKHGKEEADKHAVRAMERRSQLAARVAELEGALEPFANISLARDIGSFSNNPDGPDMIDAPDLSITPNQVRRARAVLNPPNAGEDTPVEPHDYSPSSMHMGDCNICGHVQSSPLHAGEKLVRSVTGRLTEAAQIGEEIVEIMRTYDQQEDEGCMSTPGGLEHMGDVWRLLRGWRDRLIAGEAPGPAPRSACDAPDWPPHGSASFHLEGERKYGSTGQLFEVRNSQWVRIPDPPKSAVAGPAGEQKPNYILDKSRDKVL